MSDQVLVHELRAHGHHMLQDNSVGRHVVVVSAFHFCQLCVAADLWYTSEPKDTIDS